MSDFSQYESCRRYYACGVCNKCNPKIEDNTPSPPITASQTLFALLCIFLLWIIMAFLCFSFENAENEKEKFSDNSYKISENDMSDFFAPVKTIIFICFVVQTAIIVCPFYFLYIIIKLVFAFFTGNIFNFVLN